MLILLKMFFYLQILQFYFRCCTFSISGANISVPFGKTIVIYSKSEESKVFVGVRPGSGAEWTMQ
jgi:hypothetical protein